MPLPMNIERRVYWRKAVQSCLNSLISTKLALKRASQSLIDCPSAYIATLIASRCPSWRHVPMASPSTSPTLWKSAPSIQASTPLRMPMSSQPSTRPTKITSLDLQFSLQWVLIEVNTAIILISVKWKISRSPRWWARLTFPNFFSPRPTNSRQKRIT